MQALDILKEELEIGIAYAKENLRYTPSRFFDAKYKMDVQRREQLLRDAIDELNELLSNKSCDGCIYLSGFKYHDCEHDSCARYPTLRGFPDLYKGKQ